jgi:hypothetical protein
MATFLLLSFVVRLTKTFSDDRNFSRISSFDQQITGLSSTHRPKRVILRRKQNLRVVAHQCRVDADIGAASARRIALWGQAQLQNEK